MKEYLNLIMGLVAGLALTLLNNNIVRSSLNSIFTLFDPTNTDFIFISSWVSRFIVMISFVGIFITIVYSFLILKKVLKEWMKK